MAQKSEETPHEKRRGTLRNGNSSGDFSKAPRCGAKNRRGTPCQCPAMANGRCRLHGGLSTGPKTPEGIELIRLAVTKHGRYSQQAKNEREIYRNLLKNSQELLAEVPAILQRPRSMKKAAMSNLRTNVNVDTVADALYWVTNTDQVERVLQLLSPEERDQALKKCGERADAYRLQLSTFLQKFTNKNKKQP